VANPSRIIARVAWILPLFFVGLSVHQTKVAYDLNDTEQNGTAATAEVLTVHQENRVDVTYDYISVRVPLPDGGALTKETLSLPHSIVPAINDRETLSVKVLPGAAREVVITEKIAETPIVSTQWRIAVMNAAISFGAFLLFGAGVWFWNRSLSRDGDPAARGVDAPDPEHPARQVVRNAS
jgi:hypothetical protein